MGSLSSNKIPVINLGLPDLKPGTTTWSSVRTEVYEALERYGCFEAVCNNESQLQPQMLAAMKDLLDLPIETKKKHPANDRHNGAKNFNPLYDNMGISDSQSREGLEKFTKLMWPEGNSKFCDTVHSYVNHGSNMEQMVRRMISESLGVERCFEPLVKATSYFLRINRYRAPKENETNCGLSLHTDSSFISVLCQNEVNGLEIQAKDGEWITVNPSPGSYVILVGDAFMAWSNGRLHSPPHKVIMKSDSMRYSIALFAFIKGMLIETPEELVDAEHPLQFKPFDHIGYRLFITSGEGAKTESMIRAYCGVSSHNDEVAKTKT